MLKICDGFAASSGRIEKVFEQTRAKSSKRPEACVNVCQWSFGIGFEACLDTSIKLCVSMFVRSFSWFSGHFLWKRCPEQDGHTGLVTGRGVSGNVVGM